MPVHWSYLLHGQSWYFPLLVKQISPFAIAKTIWMKAWIVKEIVAMEKKKQIKLNDNLLRDNL